MKRSMKRLRLARATRCRITSVSLVDCMIAPSRTSCRRSVRPLVRLPLWPTAKPPPSSSAEQRLHVAQDGLAGGRVAHVADRGRAGQAVDHLAAGEVVADQAHAALGMEALAVEGDDAGGLLAAVLERVQAERRDGGGIRDARKCRTRRIPRAGGRRRDRTARSAPGSSVGSLHRLRRSIAPVGAVRRG